MAVALNTFKTITAVLTTDLTTIYTAPANYTGIVLMAQIANVSNSAVPTTAGLYNGSTFTELISEYFIPANDSVSVTQGKLVLESGFTFKASASVNSSCKIILSVLETANG